MNHHLHVIFDDGWKIQYRSAMFGPYDSRSLAVATATMWAENAKRQGHLVELFVADSAVNQRSLQDSS